MICRFCGVKIEPSSKCPHCFHDTPVKLSYRSYSNNTIVDKLESVLQVRTQESEDGSASPVILDTEAALQKLTSDVPSPIESNSESKPNPIYKGDNIHKECVCDSENSLEKKQQPVCRVDSIDSKTTNNDNAALLEHQHLSDKSDFQSSEGNYSVDPVAETLPLKIMNQLRSHLGWALIGTACFALAMGYILGYVTGKKQDKEPLQNNPEETTETTFISTIEDYLITNTTERKDDAFANNAATLRNDKGDEKATTKNTTDAQKDDMVWEGVLREKESEEIQ